MCVFLKIGRSSCNHCCCLITWVKDNQKHMSAYIHYVFIAFHKCTNFCFCSSLFTVYIYISICLWVPTTVVHEYAEETPNSSIFIITNIHACV